MNKQLNTRLKAIFWPIAYGIIILGICVVSCFVFNNNYYSSIYVSGESMSPTLSGKVDDADYGIADKHDSALKKLKRWQIVTTHYPGDDRLMIKRVLFKPGDTFKVEDGQMSLKIDNVWTNIEDEANAFFERKKDGSGQHRSFEETTLAADEYFVAGDNWDSSYDSFKLGPIKYSNLVGVVVAMQGRCCIENDKPTDKRAYDKPRYFPGVDF